MVDTHYCKSYICVNLHFICSSLKKRLLMSCFVDTVHLHIVSNIHDSPIAIRVCSRAKKLQGPATDTPKTFTDTHVTSWVY